MVGLGTLQLAAVKWLKFPENTLKDRDTLQSSSRQTAGSPRTDARWVMAELVRDLQAFELALKRTRDKRATPPSMSSNY